MSKINLEGKLSKFTNVIKGYQFRHFVIDPYTATLNYYISENLKNQKPKGTILLRDSVILPSEEDPTLFSIHKFDCKIHNVYYLRAQDAKEREKWVNALKHASLPDITITDKTISDESNTFQNCCFICLDSVTESVATMCGHLFCKKCIHKWIETKPVCPVCNSKISKDKLIRLYGINETNDKAVNSSINENPTDNEPPNIQNHQNRHNQENIFQMFNQIIYGIFVYLGIFSLIICLILSIVFYFSALMGTFCFVFSVWCISLVIKR